MGLFGRDTNPEREALENVVGASTTLKGTLRSDGGIRIDGTFEGLIEVGGNVVIGESGRVIADINARNITVAGAVKGNVRGSGRLEILSTGQVLGDIAVAAVMIDEGGIFQGTSRMTGYEQRALAAPRADGAREPVEINVPSGAVEVTARPTGRGGHDAGAARGQAAARESQVREHQVQVPDLDFADLDIEPVIPDVVIEDVKGRGSPPGRAPAPGNTRRGQPGNGARRR
ncbi:hypothetical protein DCC79_01790 [bacterium]|nr:MAG: hypothetical protein DCC79_01790 [bacterium]